MTTTNLNYRKNQIGEFIDYANGETAVIRKNSIASCPDHSEAISYWSYDVEYKTLIVHYKKSENYYRYSEVPYTVIFALMTANSLGAYIAKEIKPNHEVVKI